MHSLKSIGMIAMLAVLSACATSGPLYKDVKGGIKPVAKNQARLIVYREATGFAAAIQPGIYLDGEQIGTSIPGSFVVRDIATGNHELIISTEVEKKYDFSANAGQEIYIRQAPGLGWLLHRIHIEPVTAEVAANEMADLHQQEKFEPDHSREYPASGK